MIFCERSLWMSPNSSFKKAYYFFVCRYNEDGYSTAHTEVIWTSEGIPTAPRDLRAEKITHSTISLAWLPPAARNGVILGYKLYCTHPAGYTDSLVIHVPQKMTFPSNDFNNDKGRESGTFSDTKKDLWIQYRLINLIPYSTYYVQVAAFTSKGHGDITSNGLAVVTDVAPPQSPDNINVTRVADNALLVMWSVPRFHPRKAQIYLESYDIHYGLVDGEGHLVQHLLQVSKQRRNLITVG